MPFSNQVELTDFLNSLEENLKSFQELQLVGTHPCVVRVFQLITSNGGEEAHRCCSLSDDNLVQHRAYPHQTGKTSFLFPPITRCA